MSLYKIYGSSAGSGKTFTLTKTYLQLLLSSDNPHYYKQILAITFTNDAAAEMKSRILNTLKELGGSEEQMSSKTKAMLDILKNDLADLHPSEIQKRAKASFQQILQDYADFNVKTIDSFVNQLVSSFSLDLGLPYNYEVVLDKEPILLKAAERVFDKIGLKEFEYLTDLIENYALEQADEGKNWQMLLPNLASFAKNLFDDQYYNLIQKNEGLIYSDYLLVKKNMAKYLKIAKTQFLSFGKKGSTILESHGIDPDDFKGRYSFGAFILELNNPDSKLIGAFNEIYKDAVKAAENDEWYAKTSLTDVKVKIDGAIDELKTLYFEVIKFLEDIKPKYILFSELMRSMDNLAMLDEVKNEFGKILHENNMAYITDFNRRINKVVANEPVPYIFERLGERYNHILIDEFQDTSDIQYFNLLPLIENALSKNYFNMLVGDPKQSIYRWRGGKVELMIHVLNQNTEALKSNELLSDNQKFTLDFTNSLVQKENLQKNYRSKKEIISFNNELFSKIMEESQEEIIQQAFENKTQESHEKTSSGGHVELILAEDTKGEESIDELEWTLNWIEMKIEEALNSGYVLEDIAILCRKTTGQATEIAEHLVTKGISVVSADSLLLKNNLGISFLVSLLRAYHDPTNPAKHADSILLYFRYTKQDLPTNIDFRDPELSCWGFFESQHIEIEQKVLGAFGLYQLTESLANKIGMFEDKTFLPYLFAFFDIVQNHIKNSGNSLSEFLTLWDQTSKSYSLNASKPNAITVSTIHKSKGLEYPVVIVPFANWSLLPQNTSKLWVDLEKLTYSEFESKLKAAPINFKKALESTLIADQYLKELEFNKLEALNILYVAFTRPVDRLYILAKKPRNYQNNIYQLLNEFVEAKGIKKEDLESCIFSEGAPKDEINEQVKNENVYLLGKINSRENLGKLKLKSTVDRAFNEQNQRDKGNLIHSLFSEIQMAEDLDQALQRLQFEGLIMETEKEELRKDAQGILEHTALKHLFSGQIRVENERDILVKDQDISRPDRVVFHENKVTILDYKTGQKRDSHARQIKHYGELYRQMGYENVELLLVYLNPTEVVSVTGFGF